MQRIRELEAEAALQAARAEATAAALQALEEQRSAETAAIHEQHKEELTAAHSELRSDYLLHTNMILDRERLSRPGSIQLKLM